MDNKIKNQTVVTKEEDFLSKEAKDIFSRRILTIKEIIPYYLMFKKQVEQNKGNIEWTLNKSNRVLNALEPLTKILGSGAIIHYELSCRETFAIPSFSTINFLTEYEDSLSLRKSIFCANLYRKHSSEKHYEIGKRLNYFLDRVIEIQAERIELILKKEYNPKKGLTIKITLQ